ncbi:plant-specific domain TIGR01589 family protein [Musa troglodytarum]|uniref:Plant-specific domain TIGR01589 family protein n=1 Tax=Musa troglodytarum TaxID=320322 RepID=A0A9E7JDT9_9LILI|nr:plant-specific domain TIGR01589 family protein [Musa troglodytarum]
MNQREVIDTLSFQAKIEPSFTQLVWQKLEEENREFFEAYHVRLILKNQILVFNRLLEKQVELMQRACPSGVAAVPHPNGSNSSCMSI